MSAVAGVEPYSGLVHSLTGTAVNVTDIAESEHLLHGDETEAYADAGYTGATKRPEFQGSDVVWHVAEKRGKLKNDEQESFRHRISPLVKPNNHRSRLATVTPIIAPATLAAAAIGKPP